MIRGLGILFLGMTVTVTYADAIGRYMNIVNNIPKMEMKADFDAQTWARSARNLLDLTSETIAETLALTNATATQRGAPLFCLPAETQLNAILVNNLIQQTYREISSPDSEKDSMTVSQVALMGMMKKYPCSTASPTAGTQPLNGKTTPSVGMMHIGGDGL